MRSSCLGQPASAVKGTLVKDLASANRRPSRHPLSIYRVRKSCESHASAEKQAQKRQPVVHHIIISCQILYHIIYYIISLYHMLHNKFMYYFFVQLLSHASVFLSQRRVHHCEARLSGLCQPLAIGRALDAVRRPSIRGHKRELESTSRSSWPCFQPRKAGRPPTRPLWYAQCRIPCQTPAWDRVHLGGSLQRSRHCGCPTH